jgi:hypothetical protein
MPKITFHEFVCNLHNWVHDNNVADDAKCTIGISHKRIPQYLAILEECDELLYNEEPRVMKLRKAISIFCEKIVISKDVDVGFRARAAKFLICTPKT